MNDLFIQLKTAGIEVEEALHRFMDKEDFYIKYLKKFPQDETIIKLRENVKNKNYEEVEIWAHTLKGVAANLGMVELSNSCASIVNDIRQKDMSRLEQYLERLNFQYNEICSIIQK